MSGPFFEDWGTLPAAEPERTLRTWLQNLLQTTLIDAGKSFIQTEWPVPRGYVHPTDLRTFLSQRTLVPGAIVQAFGLRRAERTTPGSAQRQEIARAERTAPGVARRVDE